MKDIVKTDLELCVGCKRCEGECPVIMANIIYQDEEGNTKVKVDHTVCIACGRCISVCRPKARYFDTIE
ncbi:MAG: 4Fe-4S binding protein [Clostridiales bacterium]|nr:4Fe-4S binding protein [Clostridiales bacterium]